MKMLEKFLKSNPEAANKYVSIGYSIIGKTIKPLNRIMIHLLNVQGVNPNTKPGETARKNLAAAVDAVMGTAKEEYESDFNFTAIKGFEKVASQLTHLKLNHEQFKKATDLTFAQDPQMVKCELFPKPSADLSTEEKAYENSLDELKAFMDTHNLSTSELPLDIGAAKKTLKTISEFVELRKPYEEKKAERKKVIHNAKKSDKSKTIKTFGKKAMFRRVED